MKSNTVSDQHSFSVDENLAHRRMWGWADIKHIWRGYIWASLRIFSRISKDFPQPAGASMMHCRLRTSWNSWCCSCVRYSRLNSAVERKIPPAGLYTMSLTGWFSFSFPDRWEIPCWLIRLSVSSTSAPRELASTSPGGDWWMMT